MATAYWNSPSEYTLFLSPSFMFDLGSYTTSWKWELLALIHSLMLIFNNQILITKLYIYIMKA